MIIMNLPNMMNGKILIRAASERRRIITI